MLLLGVKGKKWNSKVCKAVETQLSYCRMLVELTMLSQTCGWQNFYKGSIPENENLNNYCSHQIRGFNCCSRFNKSHNSYCKQIGGNKKYCSIIGNKNFSCEKVILNSYRHLKCGDYFYSRLTGGHTNYYRHKLESKCKLYKWSSYNFTMLNDYIDKSRSIYCECKHQGKQSSCVDVLNFKYYMCNGVCVSNIKIKRFNDSLILWQYISSLVTLILETVVEVSIRACFVLLLFWRCMATLLILLLAALATVGACFASLLFIRLLIVFNCCFVSSSVSSQFIISVSESSQFISVHRCFIVISLISPSCQNLSCNTIHSKCTPQQGKRISAIVLCCFAYASLTFTLFVIHEMTLIERLLPLIGKSTRLLLFDIFCFLSFFVYLLSVLFCDMKILDLHLRKNILVVDSVSKSRTKYYLHYSLGNIFGIESDNFLELVSIILNRIFNFIFSDRILDSIFSDHILIQNWFTAFIIILLFLLSSNVPLSDNLVMYSLCITTIPLFLFFTFIFMPNIALYHKSFTAYESKCLCFILQLTNNSNPNDKLISLSFPKNNVQNTNINAALTTSLTLELFPILLDHKILDIKQIVHKNLRVNSLYFRFKKNLNNVPS